MLSFIMLVALSTPNNQCPFGAVCSVSYNGLPASATITLSLTLTSAQAMSMNTEILDEGIGAYRLAVNTISTGSADATSESRKLLILDHTPQDTGIQLAVIDGKLMYDRSEDADAIVMESTPENERMVASMIEEIRLQRELIAKKSQVRLRYISMLP